MSTFVFNWFEYNKYNKVMLRKSNVSANSLNDAIGVFKNNCGGPKKVCITSIQEIDSLGNYINNVIKVNPTDFSIIKEGKEVK